jgi:hypothetical protein
MLSEEAKRIRWERELGHLIADHARALRDVEFYQAEIWAGNDSDKMQKRLERALREVTKTREEVQKWTD